MHNQDEALGANSASTMVSAWGAYTQPLDRTMMKAAELDIK